MARSAHLIVDRKDSGSFDDVIDSSEGLTYHERVMSLPDIEKVDGKVVILLGLKLIPPCRSG